MKGYIVANVTIRDRERYEEYRRRVPEIIAQYGGRYLIRRGAVTDLEGQPGLGRVVVLEFPSVEQARAFYGSPEYQSIIGIRQAASVSHLALVEGVPT